MSSDATAEKITRSSKSNLALAFVSLPVARRRDMTTFYAFCRIVDDIADEPDRSPDRKRAELDAWNAAVAEGNEGEPDLAPEVRDVIRKYNIPLEYFYEIVAGVGMDIEPARDRTFEELRRYCYRVASAVVLASSQGSNPVYTGVEQALAEPGTDLRIFGKPSTRPYRRMAVALARGAHALARARDAAAKIKVHTS